MAGPYYVRSGAGGAGTGADWANAKLTIAAAFTAAAAGDTIYVSEDHAETQASAMTLTSPGTAASPCIVLCVDHAGTVPPVSADLRTTATVSTTGANAITFGSQTTYVYGITFQSGSAGSTASQVIGATTTFLSCKSCGFKLNNTSGTSKLQLGNSASASELLFDGCTFTFGSVAGQGFSGSASLATMIGGSVVVGATVPTVLFVAGTAPTVLRLIGVDLSAFGSGKTLVGASTNNCRALLQECKLGASVTVASTPTSSNQTVDLVQSDSSGTNYRQERYHYAGTLTQETTIVRTGGASDGTQALAWKIVTTANSKWVLPFEAPPITIWNDATGSKTVTVYGIWGGGAVPLNDEIWIDVEYMGNASFPTASVATTTKADYLAAGANTTSDSSTWGGSTTAFKMVTGSITVNQKGPMVIKVKAAKASSTFYIDPLVVVA